MNACLGRVYKRAVPHLTDRLLWLLLAALHIPVGAVAFVAPELFTTRIASFGSPGLHYARDLGAAQLVLGAAAAAAAFRPDVRRCVVVLLGAHLALHTLSHLLDAGLGTASSTVSVLLALLVEAGLLTIAARRALR